MSYPKKHTLKAVKSKSICLKTIFRQNSIDSGKILWLQKQGIQFD